MRRSRRQRWQWLNDTPDDQIEAVAALDDQIEAVAALDDQIEAVVALDDQIEAVKLTAVFTKAATQRASLGNGGD
jgi:hypothetical protein